MILLVICAIFSLILYITAPVDYSYAFVCECFGCFLVSSIYLLWRNCKDTFIKFEFFFTIAFFFANYAYPLIYYPINPYFSLFTLPFNEDYICKAVALSTIGITFFNCGIIDSSFKEKRIDSSLKLNVHKFPIYILFVLFLPQLYKLAAAHAYSTEFERSLINVLLIYMIYYYLFVKFNNINNRKISTFKSSILTDPIIWLVVIYVLLFLLIGSRTIPLRIVLLFMILYDRFISVISKKYTIAILLGGALCLTFVGVVREGMEFDFSDLNSIWDIGTDLTINNRSLYVLMEYAEQHGYTYGRSMLMGVLCIIPFMQSIFLRITGMDALEITSAGIVTTEYFHRNDPELFGLGTNIIGDLYVSFGVIGVIILMFILGRILKYLNKKAYKGNVLSVLLYACIFLDVIYMPRSTYLTCTRTLVWVWFIYKIENSHRIISLLKR